MNIDKEEYKKYAERHAKKSPLFKDCLKAIVFGGAICAIAQGLMDIYSKLLGLDEEIGHADLGHADIHSRGAYRIQLI